jgi:hypothetical protein
MRIIDGGEFHSGFHDSRNESDVTGKPIQLSYNKSALDLPGVSKRQR